VFQDFLKFKACTLSSGLWIIFSAFYYVYTSGDRALEAYWIGRWAEFGVGMDAVEKRKSLVLLRDIEPPFIDYPSCILATIFVSYTSILKITQNVNI